MKKALSIILTLLLVFTMFLFSDVVANGLDEITISSIDSVVNEGDNIRIPIYISKNTGIMGFGLTFDYDNSLLTPVSVEYGEVVTSGLNDNIEGDAVPGEFKVIYSSVKKETFNGLMFYINFKANTGLYGTKKIEISYSHEDTFNDKFQDVILNCKSFNVTINQKQNTKPIQSSSQSIKPTQSTVATTKSFELKVPKFSLKKSGKKIKVNYKKITGATGFQVRYRIKDKWKTKVFETKKSITKAIKVPKKGGYTVQLRAVAKISGKTFYSNWSKYKKIKI